MWSRRAAFFIKSNSPLRQITRKLHQVQEPKTAPINDLHTLKIGETIHGFQVKEVKKISEFRITAFYLVHEKTQAEYLHLYRNDNNNVFSINFRTTPKNSTGLPHILEHTVLCGSELYPVRDPFFKMLTRSLATFMNAMTGSDYTMYPFSTQNYTDFQNLQKIYLDAVFRPKLSELDFMQEGWRLENTIPNDPKTDLIIKGVVYNEMKGVFSENDNILSQKLQNLILPDHTYGVVSGGDPMEIPKLTWDHLKEFHKQHYYPSNARFFSYGNFPLTPSLEYLNKIYLTNYAHSAPTHTVVPRQKRWKIPKREHISCRYDIMGDPIEKQNSLTVSLLLSDNTDVYDTFLMQFVSELLLKGPNAPFYKTMIEPNFSGGFTPTTGFDTQPRDCIFTVGLQGLKKDDFDRVITIYNSTIENVIKKGFEPEHIESVLHRYELAVKHETKHFGLNLLFGLTPTWNHSNDVLKSLQVNEIIEKLRANIKKDPEYLQSVVKRNFKENQHQLILSMSPDPDYEKKIQTDEKQLIASTIKKLSDKDKAIMYEKCLELQKQQEQPQNTDLLPTLSIDDISSDIEKIDKVNVTINNVAVQINKVNANGLVYFKSVLNINDLSQEQQMLLPLFCYVINKLGTDKLNYKEFDSLTNRKTGGLYFNNHIAESLYQLHTYEPGVLLSSHCLEKNAESMWDLWTQLFKMNDLKDVDRFKMLVQLYMANLTHGIADSGHVFAMQAAASLVSGSAYQVELLSGLQHISYMKRLVHTSNYKAMLEELRNMAKIMFDKTKMRVALNISPDSQANTLRSFENFINSLPQGTNSVSPDSTYVSGKVWAPTDAVNCQHHVINVPVNYCSKAVLTAPYTEKDYATLRVLAKLITSKYLHPELREKQGAYGGGAKMSEDGVMLFYSYRDPRSLETLDIFDNANKWLQANLNSLTHQDVFEAKLGVFQSIDSPIPPSMKGCDEFLKRLTMDVKQRHRADVIAVDKDSLKAVAEKYLGDENAINSGKVVLGPKNDKMDIRKRSDELWTVVDSV